MSGDVEQGRTDNSWFSCRKRKLLRCENFKIFLCYISFLSCISFGFGPFGCIKQAI